MSEATERIGEDRQGQRPCRRTDLYVGLERNTEIGREFHALRVQVVGQARQLFSPRHLLRVISGRYACWDSDGISVCLQHRLPVVFLDGKESIQGTLQPWRAQYYSLDMLIVSLLNSPDGAHRLTAWYDSRRHGIAASYLYGRGARPGKRPPDKVLEEMQHEFRIHCAPLRDGSILRRFDLAVDLVACQFFTSGKLECATMTGAVRGFGLRNHVGRLFRLEARRQLLDRELMLPDTAAAVPGFVDRVLRNELMRYNGRLHASLAELFT